VWGNQYGRKGQIVFVRSLRGRFDCDGERFEQSWLRLRSSGSINYVAVIGTSLCTAIAETSVS